MIRSILIGVLTVGTVAGTSTPALAHGTTNHSPHMTVTNRLRIFRDRIELQQEHRCRNDVAQALWDSADTDKDGKISETERRVAVDESRAIYQQWCRMDVDFQLVLPSDVQVTLTKFPLTRPAAFTGEGELFLDHRVIYPLGSGSRAAVLSIAYQCTMLNAFEVHNQVVLDSGLVIEQTSLGSVAPGGLTLVGATQTNGIPEVLQLVVRDSQAPASGRQALVAPRPDAREQETLTSGLRNRELTLQAMLILFLSAFGLGMAHALSPGHGKTMVAAYMLASRGRPWDAVVLGTVVTFTHVSVVLLLGVGTLVASHYIVPQRITAILEVVSALLVLGTGFWLLVTRSIALGRGHSGHDHDHHHGPGGHTHVPAWMLEKSAAGHHHGNDHGHDHGHEAHQPGHPHVHGHAHGLGHSHEPGVLDHSHDHAHGHEHGQDHSHDGAQASTHCHDHDHDHGHDQGHTHGPASAHGSHTGHWMELLTLGISGGIVPCPTALVVLLVAVAVGRIALGLALIVTFSFGLAIVLIGIGVAFSFGSRMARSKKEGAWVRYVPVGSAAMVLALGMFMTFQALAASGFFK